jgi:LacI family transcriptional regulator
VVRARAFRHSVRDQGLADDPALMAESAYWSEADGAQALRRLLDSGVEFTGIVGGNDLLALGCYDVFHERGLRCPEDISVVGFNGMPFLDKMQPPLTTVSIPHYELGFEAARLLLDAIDEPDRMPRSVLLAPSLVVRSSTAPPRPADGS